MFILCCFLCVRVHVHALSAHSVCVIRPGRRLSKRRVAQAAGDGVGAAQRLLGGALSQGTIAMVSGVQLVGQLQGVPVLCHAFCLCQGTVSGSHRLSVFFCRACLLPPLLRWGGSKKWDVLWQ